MLAGRTEGDYGGINAGGSDFVVVKLDAAGSKVWTWQVQNIVFVSMMTSAIDSLPRLSSGSCSRPLSTWRARVFLACFCGNSSRA